MNMSGDYLQDRVIRAQNDQARLKRQREASVAMMTDFNTWFGELQKLAAMYQNTVSLEANGSQNVALISCQRAGAFWEMTVKPTDQSFLTKSKTGLTTSERWSQEDENLWATEPTHHGSVSGPMNRIADVFALFQAGFTADDIDGSNAKPQPSVRFLSVGV